LDLLLDWADDERTRRKIWWTIRRRSTDSSERSVARMEHRAAVRDPGIAPGLLRPTIISYGRAKVERHPASAADAIRLSFRKSWYNQTSSGGPGHHRITQNSGFKDPP